MTPTMSHKISMRRPRMPVRPSGAKIQARVQVTLLHYQRCVLGPAGCWT